jgi:hypothetical protein
LDPQPPHPESQLESCDGPVCVWSFSCDELLKFAAPASADEPDDCFTWPALEKATFGDALTETAFAFAVWSIELPAVWLCPDDLSPHVPPDWLWSFCCDESFQFAAPAAADELDNWSTLPPLWSE